MKGLKMLMCILLHKIGSFQKLCSRVVIEDELSSKQKKVICSCAHPQIWISLETIEIFLKGKIFLKGTVMQI